MRCGGAAKRKRNISREFNRNLHRGVFAYLLAGITQPSSFIREQSSPAIAVPRSYRISPTLLHPVGRPLEDEIRWTVEWSFKTFRGFFLNNKRITSPLTIKPFAECPRTVIPWFAYLWSSSGDSRGIRAWFREIRIDYCSRFDMINLLLSKPPIPSPSPSSAANNWKYLIVWVLNCGFFSIYKSLLVAFPDQLSFSYRGGGDFY